MAVGKVIEISSSSTKSFEDAIQAGIQRAGKKIDAICGAWIKEQEVVVESNSISEYRVKMNVTFLLNDND